jgi:hypothetical protein
MRPLKEVVVYEMDDVQKMIENHRHGMNVLGDIQADISELRDNEVIDEATFESLSFQIKKVFNLIIQ